jgi:hypothetical protein
MEYRVEVNPAKEKEFLQLLKAWQSLGVVQDYRILLPHEADEDASYYTDHPANKKQTPKGGWEMAEPYKDLLD